MHISTKCSVAVHCLIVIHEFGKEKKVTGELLAKSTGINPAAIRSILSALKKDGIINIRPGTGGAEIAVPLSSISLYRICKAAEPDFLSKLFGFHSNPSSFCPVGKVIRNVLDSSYERIQDDLSCSLKNITMEDIIADYHSCSQL